jgi:hypothetical protein
VDRDWAIVSAKAVTVSDCSKLELTARILSCSAAALQENLNLVSQPLMNKVSKVAD